MVWGPIFIKCWSTIICLFLGFFISFLSHSYFFSSNDFSSNMFLKFCWRPIPFIGIGFSFSAYIIFFWVEIYYVLKGDRFYVWLSSSIYFLSRSFFYMYSFMLQPSRLSLFLYWSSCMSIPLYFRNRETSIASLIFFINSLGYKSSRHILDFS